MAGHLSKRLPLLLALLGMTLVATSISFVSLHRTRVFGNLSPGDLREIDQLIHRDLRRFELPTLNKENLKNPRYVLASVRQYASRRVLWVAVQDDRTVRAYVGDNKDRIVTDGWSYTLHKDPGWRIGGMAYWATPDLAPKDFKVPAGL